jgi:hypothetical protein
MAVETFYLVARDMILVKRLRRVLARIEQLSPAVTLHAGKLLNVSVSLDHVRMALLALYSSLDIQPVVKGEVGAHLYVTPGLEMAGPAARHKLFLVLALVEVANETFHLGDQHVSSLNDLRMAGRAPELLLPLHLLDVLAVIEDNVLENEVLLQPFFLVTPALKTACIIYLGVGLGRALARDKVNE